MLEWVIAIPVWGERCRSLFASTSFPAIKAAMQRSPNSIFKFVIHTSPADMHTVAKALDGYDVCFRPVDYAAVSPYHAAYKANQEALSLARPGNVVAFLNADTVPSVEVFLAAEEHFRSGKALIMMGGTRTIGNPPLGESSEKLLKWGIEHRHSIISECFFGTGRTSIPSTVYFERDGMVVMHAFHLHPFAMYLDRSIDFTGTIDWDLIDNFERDEIHVVTSPKEAALVEVSPVSRRFPLIENAISVNSIKKWAELNASDTHLWFFRHPIAIIGDGSDIGDRDICEQILGA